MSQYDNLYKSAMEQLHQKPKSIGFEQSREYKSVQNVLKNFYAAMPADEPPEVQTHVAEKVPSPEPPKATGYFAKLEEEREQAVTIACGPDEDIFAADAPAPPAKTESACGDETVRKELAEPPKPAPEQTEDQAQAYVEENENYMEQV